jgi:hypothetical protein
LCVVGWGDCNDPCATGWKAYNDLCVTGRDYSITIRNGSWDNAHTSDPSSRSERLGKEPSTLVQLAQCTGGSSDGWTGRAITNVASWCWIYGERPDQPSGWGPTFSRFSPQNVEWR